MDGIHLSRPDGIAKPWFGVNMRTTIDIPDVIFRRVKATAALEGKTLRAFVADALAKALRDRKGAKGTPTRVQLPLIRSKRPGTLRLTSAAVADALTAGRG